MLGAIIGDIVGSRFEWNNHRSKEFDLFSKGCFVTDDSIMTLAIAKAIMEAEQKKRTLEWDEEEYLAGLRQEAVTQMQTVGRPYPNCGFGGRFYHWIYSDDPKPYNSFGNGSAMRISPVGFFARTVNEVRLMSQAVTEVTHNHPEGIKGAEATALAIFLARCGHTKAEIALAMKRYYEMNFTLDEIRSTYEFNETAQDTVPQAIQAFLESDSFEDAIRCAISVGGDSDTLAAITGGIAEAFYGVPDELRAQALSFFDERQAKIFHDWEEFKLSLQAG